MPGPIETRVTGLAGDVLEPADSAATAFTADAKARCASLILLVHAEIEFAIESECRNIATSLRTSADPAAAILVWGMLKVSADGGIGKIGAKRPIESIVDAYHAMIDRNNGIKEKDLIQLLAPIGLDLGPLNTEINLLEAFGIERGDLAHRPVSSWNTKNLPATLIRNAIQAAKAADTVVQAIQTQHSAVRHRTKRSISWTSIAANTLRRAARFLDELGAGH